MGASGTRQKELILQITEQGVFTLCLLSLSCTILFHNNAEFGVWVPLGDCLHSGRNLTDPKLLTQGVFVPLTF